MKIQGKNNPITLRTVLKSFSFMDMLIYISVFIHLKYVLIFEFLPSHVSNASGTMMINKRHSLAITSLHSTRCGGQKILTQSPKNIPNIKIVISIKKKKRETNAMRENKGTFDQLRSNKWVVI